MPNNRQNVAVKKLSSVAHSPPDKSQKKTMYLGDCLRGLAVN